MQEVIKPLDMAHLPVFVKESSIIPMQSLVQTTAEAPTDTLSLHIFNGKTANEFVLYEDDGKSYNYEKSDFNKRTITFNPTQHKITIGEAAGNFISKFKTVKLVLHGFSNIGQSKINGKAIKVVQGYYTMIDPVNNIDPQGANGGRRDAAQAQELSFSLSNQKQVLDY